MVKIEPVVIGRRIHVESARRDETRKRRLSEPTGNANISRGLDRRSGSQVGRDTDRLEDRGDGDERLGVSDGELVTADAKQHR